MEIKRQITGMMRLLSDKTSRVYQRVGTEQDSLTKMPLDRHLTWEHQPAPSSLASEDHQINSWNSTGDPGPSPSSISTPIPNGPGCGQYSTRSKALRIFNNTKDLIKVNEANGRVPKLTKCFAKIEMSRRANLIQRYLCVQQTLGVQLYKTDKPTLGTLARIVLDKHSCTHIHTLLSETWHESPLPPNVYVCLSRQ